MTESRDLREHFHNVHYQLSTMDLDVKLLVVHDKVTGIYEALDDNSNIGLAMVDILKRGIYELKKIGERANNGQHL